MNANELIARAETLCRRRRIPFPPDLRQYASQWQREMFDLEFCWQQVKPMLSASQPLWRAEVEIRRHHDRLQRDRDGKDRQVCKPVPASPTPTRERPWGHRQAMPPPASAGGAPDDPAGFRPCAKPRQKHRAPRHPYRRRTDTKAHKVRELLKAQVIRRGPASARKLELIAKGSGLLRQDQENQPVLDLPAGDEGIEH